MQRERGRKAFPHPARLKQTGLGPEQTPRLKITSACANPKGFGALLGYLPQNPSGSALPEGSITQGLVLVGYHDGG